MQAPKSRPGSLDVPQKPSPSTPGTGRSKLRTPGSDSKSASSPNLSGKTSKERSPRVVNRLSPRSPATEKKKPGRVSELELQLANLQEELKMAKEQLSPTESWKTRAEQEAEDCKIQLASMSAKLDEAQKQLKDLSGSEEARVQELRKISQDRDRAWQSELEAIQKQHSIDSDALASALSEIQRLKIQLDQISESEASQTQQAEIAQAEIESMRLKITETHEVIEKLKNQLNASRESEAQVLEELSTAQIQLEVVRSTDDKLQLEHASAMESYKSMLMELEQSKSKVDSLEELVSNLQAELANRNEISAVTSDDTKVPVENGECDDQAEKLKTEVSLLKHEVAELKDALEDAERRYQDQTLMGNLQKKNAYELVEHAKSESFEREAELETKLKESWAELEELRTKLIEKENALRSASQENEMNREVQQNKLAEREAELELELKKTESVLQDLKTSLMDKEVRLQSIKEENEILKSEITKGEEERNQANAEALASAEVVKAAEQEALQKLAYLTEEANKSTKKTARVTEQLEATQAANADMEAELRKLKVQSDQWRKAAEAAAAILSSGNNGKHTERSGQLDYNTIGGKLGSPYSEDIDDDDSPKKKNGSMLKKLGVLLKKGQK